MKLTPWRCDGECNAKTLIRIVDALVWVPAGCVVVALMVGSYVLGRWAR